MDRIDTKLYRIKQIGYYSRSPSAIPINNAKNLIENLKQWISTIPTIDTTTSPSDVDGVDEKIYCLSVVKSSHNNDHVITLWVGIDTGDGNIVGAIKPSSNAGNIDLETRGFSDGSIPGFPLYFYVIPERNIIFPVRFNGSKNGIKIFQHYFYGFLTRYSSYCNYRTDEEGSRVVDFHGPPNSRDLGYYPRFSYRTWESGSVRERLHENVERITRVLKRSMAVTSSDRNLVQRMAGIAGSAIDDRFIGANFKYEIDYSPTVSEIDGMLSEYASDTDNSELDYGFKIGEDTVWLSHSIRKYTTFADVRKRQGILYSSSGIINALQSTRAQIITDVGGQP